jgi:hypothetical protein
MEAMQELLTACEEGISLMRNMPERQVREGEPLLSIRRALWNQIIYRTSN